MMKYKYRLVENNTPDGGEENGLKKIDNPKELRLTTHGNVTADDVINILKNPEYFSTVFIDKSKDLLSLERKVFGDKPSSSIFVNTNKNIYSENGVKLYKEIEKTVGREFKKNFIIKRDSNNKIIFAFPVKDITNQKILSDFLNIKPKVDIKSQKINDSTLIFDKVYEKDIEKILKTAKEAKAISSKDYSLETIDKAD